MLSKWSGLNGLLRKPSAPAFMARGFDAARCGWLSIAVCSPAVEGLLVALNRLANVLLKSVIGS
jgi:hypothetical protein